MSLEFPTIYLLPTHIEPDKLPELESKIPTLTYDINEAAIILGNISHKERAKFELRRKKILFEDIDPPSPPLPYPEAQTQNTGLKDAPSGDGSPGEPVASCGRPDTGDESIIKVVKLAWFVDCLAQGAVLPIDEYLIYQGRKVRQSSKEVRPHPRHVPKHAQQEGKDDQLVLKGAPTSAKQNSTVEARTKRPILRRESTSEFEPHANMPPIPDYLHTTYSCQRPTFSNPPNRHFIAELRKIRKLKALKGDEVGVRAYSTSIASLAAYPFLISHPAEVTRLPGCGDKIATLYRQWKATGYFPEVQYAEADPKMSVLQLFHGIWGVAPVTAREFYNKGWRELDDIIEYGWHGLTRVQQIGVKYYEELQEKIPRHEVRDIGKTILSHANKLRQGFQMVIAGGYRRGKTENGDVDVILSHPDAAATLHFIEDVVASLEKEGFITHTLVMATGNNEPGQIPLSRKRQGPKAGLVFDTLDKAMVVWQNPQWDRGASPRNSNPHRRVDIVVTPWETAGCAVVGWTGGTTFERDLRRYCKQERGLKFDSSGVRSRVDGSWVDLERDADGSPPDMLTAEKRVFERLGLEWRPPEERCTD
ncbi:Nucleotidyltransferase [Durotheca rogersii]|uniref:Nucleotidyltransferase n=1 Tax=Durotheca rogersii TaxID=419775 RepID=UPI00221ED14B|nr:Nucleotidyltransferase [Durotheca rogersii]KAI5867130.1 Nucleotidyltransferase [Durotheca rogersii]